MKMDRMSRIEQSDQTFLLEYHNYISKRTTKHEVIMFRVSFRLNVFDVAFLEHPVYKILWTHQTQQEILWMHPCACELHSSNIFHLLQMWLHRGRELLHFPQFYTIRNMLQDEHATFWQCNIHIVVEPKYLNILNDNIAALRKQRTHLRRLKKWSSLRKL